LKNDSDQIGGPLEFYSKMFGRERIASCTGNEDRAKQEELPMQCTSNTQDLGSLQGAVVGETPEIQKIYQIIQTAARTTNPVLIIGENGTGKEVIARAIHSTSSRRHLPFSTLDCTKLQKEDLSRELLGLANDSRDVSRPRGTLFLDRVLDLGLDHQGILLRAIQQVESSSRKNSATYEVRLLAASTRDIHSAVAEGAFRRDLYFRLNALSLRVPPLRERRRDIPLLAASFLNQFASARHEYRFTDEALRALLTYDWPGNVRELERCVERACLSSAGPTIGLLDLPSSISGVTTSRRLHLQNIRVVPLSELEKRSIRETLLQVRGNKLAAAKLLGIGKTTLYRKLRQYESEDQ
jgi:DNA-binding NtrC family response regulator